MHRGLSRFSEVLGSLSLILVCFVLYYVSSSNFVHIQKTVDIKCAETEWFDDGVVVSTLYVIAIVYLAESNQ